VLIPSIDLRGGRIVQLVQGERLALESDDVEGWIRRFERFPKVQLIDLDAALGTGDNAALVARICARLPCRVGGGIRTMSRAAHAIAAGATSVIAGSALFRNGRPDAAFAAALAAAVGRDRIVGAVDSRGGKVAVDGWTRTIDLTAAEAVGALEPWCGEFLYTHVDTEGLMQGIDFEAVAGVRRATRRPLSAAGGITTREEIDRLDGMGVDAVVGMAIYAGRMNLEDQSGDREIG
jgi:phosphoribosylformimino-5-aminoimidazole carboxamide ribotide isomerase